MKASSAGSLLLLSAIAWREASAEVRPWVPRRYPNLSSDIVTKPDIADLFVFLHGETTAVVAFSVS